MNYNFTGDVMTQLQIEGKRYADVKRENDKNTNITGMKTFWFMSFLAVLMIVMIWVPMIGKAFNIINVAVRAVITIIPIRIFWKAFYMARLSTRIYKDSDYDSKEYDYSYNHQLQIEPAELSITDKSITYKLTDFDGNSERRLISRMNLNTISDVRYSEEDHSYYVYGSGDVHDQTDEVGKDYTPITEMRILDVFNINVKDIILNMIQPQSDEPIIIEDMKCTVDIAEYDRFVKKSKVEYNNRRSTVSRKLPAMIMFSVMACVAGVLMLIAASSVDLLKMKLLCLLISAVWFGVPLFLYRNFYKSRLPLKLKVLPKDKLREENILFRNDCFTRSYYSYYKGSRNLQIVTVYYKDINRIRKYKQNGIIELRLGDDFSDDSKPYNRMSIPDIYNADIAAIISNQCKITVEDHDNNYYDNRRVTFESETRKI